MKNKVLILASLLILAACTKPSKEPPKIDWGGEPSTPTASDTLRANDAYVWVSCEGNWEEFANSRENIARDIAKLKECGFTDLVVDVRPTNGGVLFKSSHASDQNGLLDQPRLRVHQQDR